MALARRKEATLAALPKKPPRSFLVSLADKTHNARAILIDYRAIGDALWPRFTGGRDGTLWYYTALAALFARALPGPLARELAENVAGFSRG